MMKKEIALIPVVIILLAACIVGLTQTQKTLQNNNTTPQNNTTTNSTLGHENKSSKAAEVAIHIEGCPKTAKKGQNVTLTCVILNKGTLPIYNVRIFSQNFDKTMGTIKPGETKKYSYTEYIWTDEEVKASFGPDAKVSNPYPIGGDTLYFKDADGVKHRMSFESYNIKLI